MFFGLLLSVMVMLCSLFNEFSCVDWQVNGFAGGVDVMLLHATLFGLFQEPMISRSPTPLVLSGSAYDFSVVPLVELASDVHFEELPTVVALILGHLTPAHVLVLPETAAGIVQLTFTVLAKLTTVAAQSAAVANNWMIKSIYCCKD
jgi:ABC-type uncharacterized transport system permease subunit